MPVDPLQALLDSISLSQGDFPDRMIKAGEIAQRNRLWKEQKNVQRQQIMSELGRGTSMTFNEKDLERKKERFQNYYNKHKGSMDENTLEMGQFMLDDFDIQAEKNTDFNKFLLDGEQFNKDMVYDMQNIGYDLDEEGNKVQRTLDQDDWQLITDMQNKWIKHTADGQTKFADRLALKPFAHINTQLTNSTSANQFLLQQAREDDIIDDQELQVYMDAWGGLNTDGIEAYNDKQKAVDGTILQTSGETMIQDMQTYEQMYNFLYGTGEMTIQDQTLPGGKFTGTAAKYAESQIDPKTEKPMTLENLQDSWMLRLENLDQKIANSDKTFTGKSQGISLMGDSNFIRHADRDAFKVPEGVGVFGKPLPPEVATGEKDVLDITKDVYEKEGGADVDGFVDDWKDKAAIGAAGAYGLYQVSKGAIDYVQTTLNVAEESKIAGFLQSPDAQRETQKIHKIIDKVKKLSPDDPNYSSKKKIYTKRIAKLASEFAKKHGHKFDASKDDIIKLMKNADKWNIWRVKNTVGRGLRETYKTGEDLLKVAGKGGAKISPLTGALMGWHLGEVLGLGTAGKVATAYGGVKGTQRLFKKIGEKGWQEAIGNSRLRSKLAGFVIKKAPWLAAKITAKAGVGALTASTGFGLGVSAAMAAWTLNDIRTIIQDIPEVKQLFIDFTEGKFDEE